MALFTARVLYPDTVEREAGNVVEMEVYQDGVQSIPTGSGVFNLLGPSGTVHTSATTTVGGVATATMTALDLPDTVGFGEGYRETWALPLVDGRTHTFTREAAVAKFRLYPPSTAGELLADYPGLASDFGNAIGSLQPFMDKAWGRVVRRLWSLGTWPDMIVSTAQLIEIYEDEAYYKIFRALLRKTPGSNNRWETLMELHKTAYETGWGKLTVKLDRDQDGLADSNDRHGAGTLVHRNAAPQRYRRFDPRF